VDQTNRYINELRAQHGCFRLLLLVYLSLGSIGGLYGGYLLAHEVKHWAAWLFSFLVLEPIGVLCLVAFVAGIAPDSAAAELLAWAVPRAARAAWIVGILFLALISGMFLMVLRG
jgi:hypothetical protein